MLIRSAATAMALVFAATPAVMAQEATTTEETTAAVNDIVMGAEDAPVTFIEYASYTCGHCANFHNNVFPDLKAEYIDSGQVKFIQRDVYFDQIGLWAGILARCGGDDKFYAVTDMLFTEQQEWLGSGSGDQIASSLRRIGLKAGMTEEQMTACWQDSSKAEALIANFQQNATADEIEATPTFIIAGEKVMNQPWEGLKQIIDTKLAEAEAQ